LKLRTVTQLFTQIFQEPFFDILRTQEQLGYIVRQSTRALGPSIGVRFVIQSERNPVYLEERIESFLSGVAKLLDEMTVEEFKAHIAALISRLVAKKRRLADETDVYWGQILLQQYEFEKVYTDAEYLREHVTLEDMKTFVRMFILRGAPMRRKFTIHLWSEGSEAQRQAAYAPLQGGNVQVFEDPKAFSAVVKLFPPTYSLTDIVSSSSSKRSAPNNAPAVALVE
jgi:secreted Zn-dependent insulinase-like peptidase